MLCCATDLPYPAAIWPMSELSRMEPVASGEECKTRVPRRPPMCRSDAKETRVPVCLVHGNPETAAVWDRLAPLLDRGPVVRLSPPGFGAPVPPGFTATVEEYRRWLVTELERFEQPVHLVGHDWGGAHVVNVAMTRPELVRSWVSDVIGLFDQDYRWHDRVQVWATPGAGEEAIAAMIDPPVTE